jgi:hypothetical protein
LDSEISRMSFGWVSPLTIWNRSDEIYLISPDTPRRPEIDQMKSILSPRTHPPDLVEYYIPKSIQLLQYTILYMYAHVVFSLYICINYFSVLIVIIIDLQSNEFGGSSHMEKQGLDHAGTDCTNRSST